MKQSNKKIYFQAEILAIFFITISLSLRHAFSQSFYDSIIIVIGFYLIFKYNIATKFDSRLNIRNNNLFNDVSNSFSFSLLFVYFSWVMMSPIIAYMIQGSGIEKITIPQTIRTFLLLFSIIASPIICNKFHSLIDHKYTLTDILLFSMIIFVLANFISLAINPPTMYEYDVTGAQNGFLSSFGITARRYPLPFAGGLNASGILGSILIGISFTKLATNPLKKAHLPLTGLLFGIAAILLTGTRGVLIGIIFVVIFFLLRKNSIARFIILLLTALFPLLMPLLISSIGYILPSEIILLFSRGQFSDPAAELTTGRTYVWEAAMNALLRGGWDSVFGFGMNGQVTSGASWKYSWLFNGQIGEVADSHTVHNTILQAALDHGIFGATLLMILMISTAIKANKALKQFPNNPEILAGISIIITTIIASANEVVISPYFPEFIFMFIIGSTVIQKHISITKNQINPTNDEKHQ